MSVLIESGSTVLFQGDSITDWGRVYDDPASLGPGYAGLVAERFAARCPDRAVTFMNRGISGHRVCDLQARWQADCIDLRPDWVSILIGINDMWRRYDSNDPTSPEAFEATYRSILTDVREKLDARLILCEPFLLPVRPELDPWRGEDLDPKIHVVRRLAREFEAIYIPFDGLFAAAATQAPPAAWAEDGVHPTEAGHSLMADAWLRAVGLEG